MAECKRKQPKVICVEVKEALKAIQKCMHARLDEMEMECQKKLDEEIKLERLKIIKSMKDMHLENEDPVSVKKYNDFLKHEDKLHTLYMKSLNPNFQDLKEEIDAMTKDCLKFFKYPFWDPSKCDSVSEPKLSGYNWSWICLFVICVLFSISMCFAFKGEIPS